MRIVLLALVTGTAFQLSTGGAAPLAEPPVAEIVLERGPCLGSCPIYRITLRSDGTASFVGWNHVERVGVYSGGVAPDTFRSLADLVESVRFSELEDSYLQPVMDLPVVRTTVHWNDSTRKVVRDHGLVGVAAAEGPAVLLELQAAIDRVGAGISWTRVSAHPGVLQPGAL